MKNSFVESLIDHHKGYLVRYVTNPSKEGYFIEAICRLDSLFDSLIIDILVEAFPKEGRLLNGLKSNSSLIPMKVVTFLKEQEIIDNNTIKRIRNFKSCRNTLVHNPHGDIDIAILHSGFHKRKDICHDCEGCFSDHLKKLGITSLDAHAKSVLQEKVSEGLEIYGKLEIILKDARKLKMSRDQKLKSRFKKTAQKK